MTTNATYTPPSYAVNLMSVYKDTLVYMTSYDTCYVCIGNAEDGHLKVSQRYTIQRQNDNSWKVVDHSAAEYVIEGVTTPYYTYSNYAMGSQLPSAYYYKQMGFYAKGVFVLLLACIMGKAVIRLFTR